MNRIGIITGRLYSQEDYDSDRINECAYAIGPTELSEKGLDEAINIAKIQRLLVCPGCRDCEESQKAGLVG